MGIYAKGHCPIYVGEFSGGEVYPDMFPVALPATMITFLTFRANWQAFDDALSYILEVSYSIGFEALVAGYAGINVGNVLFHDITVPYDGSNYYYRIKVITSEYTTGYSNIIGLMTLDILSLKVHDTRHLHRVDTVKLVENCTLTVQDSLHGHTADNITIEEVSTQDIQVVINTTEYWYSMIVVSTGTVEVDWNDGSDLEVYEAGDYISVFHYYQDFNPHTITIHHAQNLSAIEAEYAGVTAVTGLVDCPNILWLRFTGSNLTEFETTPNWTQLQGLGLNYNSDLGSITLYEEWTEFQWLDVEYCGLTEITLFESWLYFYGINIAQNNLTEIEIFESWNMYYINIGYNYNLGSFTTYSVWTGLSLFEAPYCGLTSIDLFEEWTGLCTLILNGNQVHSIDTFASWQGMNYFAVEDCHLESLTLHQWYNLKYLMIGQNPYSSITLYGWSQLLQISLQYLPNLTSVDLKATWTKVLAIYCNNSGFTTLTYRSGWTESGLFFNGAFCYLTENAVNAILIDADNSGRYSNYLYLQGTNNAAPTGAGITAKNNLKNTKGWTVSTN